MVPDKFDVVAVGSSFASIFFVERFLKRFPGKTCAIIERGIDESYEKRIADRGMPTLLPEVRLEGDSWKKWLYSISLGGTSNIWWGQTPRLLPDDFRMKTLFGVERDWPLSYEDLEKSYVDAERMIVVSGEPSKLFPRSVELPQPAHRGNGLDIALKRLYPDYYMISPTARPVNATENRAGCCNNGACGACPIDSKFRTPNELKRVFEHKNVYVFTSHTALAVEHSNGVATGVVCKNSDREKTVKGDLIFLGANAIFNPALLQVSGLGGGWCGVGITEQVGLHVDVLLAKENSFTGSTHIAGIGFNKQNLESGKVPRYIVENYNSPPLLRFEPGKLLQRAKLKIAMESYLQDESTVIATGDGITVKHIQAHKSIKENLETIKDSFRTWISKAGAEDVIFAPSFTPTEGHIQCSVRMSERPSDGVVDKHLVHHKVRNLLVGGAGVFPTCPPSNPSLTIAALSLWAADHV